MSLAHLDSTFWTKKNRRQMSLTQTACWQKQPLMRVVSEGIPKIGAEEEKQTNKLDFGGSTRPHTRNRKIVCVCVNLKHRISDGFTISATNKDCKTTHGHTSQSNSQGSSLIPYFYMTPFGLHFGTHPFLLWYLGIVDLYNRNHDDSAFCGTNELK